MLGQAFKSDCEWRSVEFRRRMGLEPIDPLRALDVAEASGIAVWPVDRPQGVPISDRVHLVGAGRDEWFGFTLHVGDRHLIVANTARPPECQNSMVMHEIAHIMLGHRLAPVSTRAGVKLGIYRQHQEDEAAWLGSTLLVPRPALNWMRQQRLSHEDATTHFGISPALLAWRLRVTGIDRQLAVPQRTPLPAVAVSSSEV